MSYRPSHWIVAASAVLAFGSVAIAATVERTPGGVAYVEGGIGLDESQAMETESRGFSLRLRTAARGSGAYLADVDLTIRDAQGHEVFHRQLGAPWLLIDLPPGRYEIVGVNGGAVAQQSVTLAPRGHREAVLYFAVEGETRPHRADED